MYYLFSEYDGKIVEVDTEDDLLMEVQTLVEGGAAIEDLYAFNQKPIRFTQEVMMVVEEYRE